MWHGFRSRERGQEGRVAVIQGLTLWGEAFFIVNVGQIRTITAMTDHDLNKVLKQHLEMESFFAGDFTVKGGPNVLFQKDDDTQQADEQHADG